MKTSNSLTKRLLIVLSPMLVAVSAVYGAGPNQTAQTDTVGTVLTKEQVLRRVGELKEIVDRKYWPTFNSPEYSLGMNYYEDGSFRMHLVQNDGDSVPRMECSSPEVTFRAVPGVKTYEEWYAMLVHEFFHAFQHRKYPAFWNRMIETNPHDFYASDSLMALRRNYDWYREMLSRENELLVAMYHSSDIAEVRRLFARFLPIRNKRLQMVKDRLGLDIRLFYPLTEANEGSARYIEYCLYREQGLTRTEWMLDFNGCYYYASGLYMILIMDKLGIEYKDELFSRYFTLPDILADKLGIRKDGD
ncbi:MAG: hypothetical protein IKR18_08815 [Bacteroidaceae bacterium]|nr:hypothetical protein [Bacteroidaceae bacterium]